MEKAKANEFSVQIMILVHAKTGPLKKAFPQSKSQASAGKFAMEPGVLAARGMYICMPKPSCCKGWGRTFCGRMSMR
jgi:hypothetical protein